MSPANTERVLSMSKKNKDYTVIGIYADTQQSWVEWVEAQSPVDAVEKGIQQVYNEGKNGPELQDILALEVFAGKNSGLLDPHALGLPDQPVSLEALQAARQAKSR